MALTQTGRLQRAIVSGYEDLTPGWHWMKWSHPNRVGSDIIMTLPPGAWAITAPETPISSLRIEVRNTAQGTLEKDANPGEPIIVTGTQPMRVLAQVTAMGEDVDKRIWVICTPI